MTLPEHRVEDALSDPGQHMTPNNHKRSQSVSLRNRILSLPTLLSFGVAAAFMFLLATQFDLDWSETLSNIRSMNPWLYLLALLLYYLSFVFRGVRWRLLALNAVDTDEEREQVPSVLQCSQVIIIGWFVNSIVWLRLGDAYRARAFSEDAKNTFSWSLGTVLAERVLDMATVAAVLFLSLLVLTATSDMAVSQFISVMAFVMAFGVLAIILSMRLYGSKASRFLPSRLEGPYKRFQQGTLGSFKSQLPYMLILGLSGWLVEMARHSLRRSHFRRHRRRGTWNDRIAFAESRQVQRRIGGNSRPFHNLRQRHRHRRVDLPAASRNADEIDQQRDLNRDLTSLLNRLS